MSFLAVLAQKSFLCLIPQSETASAKGEMLKDGCTFTNPKYLISEKVTLHCEPPQGTKRAWPTERFPLNQSSRPPRAASAGWAASAPARLCGLTTSVHQVTSPCVVRIKQETSTHSGQRPVLSTCAVLLLGKHVTGLSSLRHQNQENLQVGNEREEGELSMSEDVFRKVEYPTSLFVWAGHGPRGPPCGLSPLGSWPP